MKKWLTRIGISIGIVAVLGVILGLIVGFDDLIPYTGSLLILTLFAIFSLGCVAIVLFPGFLAYREIRKWHRKKRSEKAVQSTGEKSKLWSGWRPIHTKMLLGGSVIAFLVIFARGAIITASKKAFLFGTGVIVALVVIIALILVIVGIARLAPRWKGYKGGFSLPKFRLGKMTWSLLWIALLGGFVLWLMKPEAMQPLGKWAEKRFAEKPDFTLGCGTDGYIELPLKSEVTVLVLPQPKPAEVSGPPPPPRVIVDEETGEEMMEDEEWALEEEGCWTDWLLRPYKLKRIVVQPLGVLDVEVKYADGSSRLELEYDPAVRVVGKSEQRSFRFRNYGTQPIKVKVLMYY